MLMVGYKPLFRPMYTYGHKSWVERISDTFYDSFRDKTWKDIKDDFVASTSDDLKDPYKVTIAAGTIFSIFANGFTANYEDVHGYAREAVEWGSFWVELGVHAGFSTGAFILSSRAKGLSWAEIGKNLFELFLITAPIALVPYPHARNFLADVYMDANVRPMFATPLAQVTLLPAYYGAVVYTKDNIAPKIKERIKRCRDGLKFDSRTVGAKRPVEVKEATEKKTIEDILD